MIKPSKVNKILEIRIYSDKSKAVAFMLVATII